MKPSKSTLLWMYETMETSRRFEELIAKIYFEGKTPAFNMTNGPIPGEMHLSNGQEPVAVGVCAHLEKEDVVTATHRSHHQVHASLARVLPVITLQAAAPTSCRCRLAGISAPQH